VRENEKMYMIRRIKVTPSSERGLSRESERLKKKYNSERIERARENKRKHERLEEKKKL